MIYVVFDPKGDDFGTKTEFQNKVIDYFTANSILCSINNIQQRLTEFPKLKESLEIESFNNKREYDIFMRGLETVSFLGGDDYVCYYYDTDAILTTEKITHLLLDNINDYHDNVFDIVNKFLQDNSDSKTYWDGWFRGAKGKDLENTENGVVYKN